MAAQPAAIRPPTQGDASESSFEAWLKRNKRMAELIEKDDWVTVWSGATVFAFLVVNASTGSAQVVWDGNASRLLSALMTFLFLLVGPLVAIGWRFLGGAPKVKALLPGFFICAALALLGRTIGKQPAMKQVGLGASVWTLVLGMTLSNLVARKFSIKIVEPAAKLAEFFIKIGLVLLAIELSTLGTYGLAGLLVAWCVTPICVLVIYFGGVKYIAPTASRSLVVLLAAGISVCGGSAITATASAIKAPQEEQALAISLVSFFTIFYMLALPYIALALGIDPSVAAAWIGGSINNTGNVVASVQILDSSTQRPDGTGPCPGPGCPGEMGPVIKMAQNAILGVVTVMISVYWITYEEEEQPLTCTGKDVELGVTHCTQKAAGLALSDSVAEEQAQIEAADSLKSSHAHAEAHPAPSSVARTPPTSRGGDGGSGGGSRPRKWPGMIVLWDRFPKFVLGFLVLSVVISLLALGPMGVGERGQRQMDVLLADLAGASNWWFYIGFVGIGINTDVARMASKLQGGSVLYLYLAGQTFNVVLTLLVAWLSFSVAGLGPSNTA